jgi:zinc protease
MGLIEPFTGVETFSDLYVFNPGLPLASPRPNITDDAKGSTVAKVNVRNLKWISLIFILSLFILNGCKREIEYLGVEFETSMVKLKNGIQVLVVEAPQFKSVSYQTWVRVGSVDETLLKTGLSHLFEHALGEDFESDTELENLGVVSNATSARDGTAFSSHLVAGALDRLIEKDAARFLNFVTNDEKLKHLKMVIFEELRIAVETRVELRSQLALWQELYPSHPYGRPVFGFLEDLQALTAADMQDFFDRFYRPDRMAIIVVGPVKAAAVVDKIKKEFADFKVKPSLKHERDPRKDLKPERPGEGEKQLVLKEPRMTPAFSLGYRAPSAHDSDAHSIDVLSQILFEGKGSRAGLSLNVPTPLVLEWSSVSLTPAYPGMLSVQGVLNRESEFEVLQKRMDQMLTDIREGGVTDAEVSTAVRQLTVELMEQLRTPGALAHLLGTVFVTFGEFEVFQKDLEKYLAVSASKVKAAAEKYLDPNQRAWVFVKPSQEEVSR